LSSVFPDPATAIELIVEAAYGALFHPEKWRDMLELYLTAVDSHFGALHSAPSDGEFGSLFLTHNIDPTPVLPVLHIYGRQAPYMDRALSMGIVPGVFLNHEVIPQTELHQLEYYQEYMRPLGFEHGITAVLRTGEGNRLSPIAISGSRSDRGEPFGEREAAITRALFPHLRRAIRLRLEVDPARMVDPAIAEALDGFDTACCLLGAGGAVVQTNAVARTLLARHPGISISKSRLKSSNRFADRALSQAVEAVCDPAALWVLRSTAEITIAGEGAEPLILVVMPLGHDNPFLSVGAIRAAVYILETGKRPFEPDRLSRLKSLFSLSQAESEVTGLILSGNNPEDIARSRDVSVHTVRTQIRTILEKTQSTRQSDLFRLTGLTAGQRSRTLAPRDRPT
jgi:DNA-binding CsgD family transcriptional regulator